MLYNRSGRRDEAEPSGVAAWHRLIAMEHLSLNIPQSFNPVYGSNDGEAPCSFQNFPKEHGWDLEASTGRLTPATARPSIPRFGDLLRSWLFFRLIAAVVYDDNRLLCPAGLHDDKDFMDQSGRLYTAKLPEVLEKWQAWEITQKGTVEQRMRMIRAQLALDLAKKVVVRNCSAENMPRSKARSPYQTDKNLALLLMILGETLTSAKAGIIKQVGFDVRGWYGDPSIGWGTPVAVVTAMREDGWCPRTVKLLQVQLRHNATALLSAYASHLGYVSKGHDKCTDRECEVRSLHPLHHDQYATKHHPDCLHGDDHGHKGCYPFVPSSDGTQTFGKPCLATTQQVEYTTVDEDTNPAPTCRRPCHNMIGLDMDAVVNIIEQDRVPLVRFRRRLVWKDGKTSRADIVLEVTDDVRSPHYATISHIWSDGYGNSRDNRCQLDYFWRLLRQAETYRSIQGQGIELTTVEPLPFWLDTLVIPVKKSVRSKKARTKAIHQIHRVFSNAKYTVVIDNGLSTKAWDYGNYTTTAMRILASGWMRRLWTLQEAYLSQRLLFAFKGSTDDADRDIPLIDLDIIEGRFRESTTNLASSLPAATRSYYDNLLGPDRIARIHKLTTMGGSSLIASVWRAAKWRVSGNS
jgi:hypothetical protein